MVIHYDELYMGIYFNNKHNLRIFNRQNKRTFKCGYFGGSRCHKLNNFNLRNDGFMDGAYESGGKIGFNANACKIIFANYKFLFPDFSPESKAARAICMNITANLLGLGNAATPFGIEAMKEMQKSNGSKSVASKSMIMFVIINTASLQLIPTMLCTIRQKYGSQNPLDILPCIWISSLIALICGITSAKIFEKMEKSRWVISDFT